MHLIVPIIIFVLQNIFYPFIHSPNFQKPILPFQSLNSIFLQKFQDSNKVLISQVIVAKQIGINFTHSQEPL